MKRLFKRSQDRALERMFETRSEAWEAVGLSVEVSTKTVRAATRRLLICLPLLVAVFVAKDMILDHISRHQDHLWLGIFSATTVTVVAVVAVLVLGWFISRDVGRVSPRLFRRMDPSTAGTVEFLVRLALVAATVLLALSVAGVKAQTIAVGGAFTAVVIGLAAQQTLGNLFAGMVLLSARPFRLGERVRLQAGAIGGTQEGIVASLGLLYTTLARGDDRIMIPNNLVLAAVVVPVKEPEAVDVRVDLTSAIKLSQIQELLDANVQTPTLRAPEVALEGIQGDNVSVRVRATPERRSEGAALADEIISALAHVTGEHRISSDGHSPS